MTGNRLRAALDVLLDREAPGRAAVRIDLIAVHTDGDFDRDARFDLFTDGDRAGYALRPDQVKTQIAERLDIIMRRAGGYAPPSRNPPRTAETDPKQES